MAAKTATQQQNERDVNEIAEEIEANIERAASLAEAENVEALAALNDETEELISSLPSRGKVNGKTAAQAKKEYRAAFKAAATVQEKPQAKPQAAEVQILETRDYHTAEGVAELVTLGAQKFSEGVRTHLKFSHLAADVARVLLDMRVRMTDKKGAPDVKALSHGSKSASKDMYAAAGDMFRAGGEVSKLEAKQATAKLIKSVQNIMPTVRAEYLRSLDEDKEEAARFELITKSDQSKGMSVSEAVAAYYGVELKSRYELEKERAEVDAIEAGDSAEEGETAEGKAEQSPAEIISAFFEKAEDNIERAVKALKKVNDDQEKEYVKTHIDSLIAELATLKAGL